MTAYSTGRLQHRICTRNTPGSTGSQRETKTGTRSGEKTPRCYLSTVAREVASTGEYTLDGYRLMVCFWRFAPGAVRISATTAEKIRKILVNINIMLKFSIIVPYPFFLPKLNW